MKSFCLFIAGLLMALAWLLPIHYRPWVTYTGELFAFFALFSLSMIYLTKRFSVVQFSLPLLILACIPLIQWSLGLVFFFDKALLCSIFIFSFWLAIQLAYNLGAEPIQQQKIFSYFCYLLLSVGVITSFIAICQWLNIEHYFYGMSNLSSRRPYANFAQPNNMATFLFMSLLATWYLYEKQKLHIILLILCAAMMIFAMALSQSRTTWVGILAVLFYVSYQYYRGVFQLKWYWLGIWTASFIFFIFSLPWLSQILANFSQSEVTQTVDLARRATGDMSRLAIWEQMWAAVVHQPWWGYGWHQTSVAYAIISDVVQGPVWIRSAHNFVLDFLLWNGLIIGIPFLLYFIFAAWQMHYKASSLEAVIGLLMLGVFLIHALLEFPQHYAYFLLPVGFIIGIILADQKQLKTITLSSLYLQISFILSLGLLGLIYRDYSVVVPQLNQAIKYEKQPEKITYKQPIYLLEEFDRRIDWIAMSPYQQLSKQQLNEIGEMVLNYPIPYDLIKYAKALAFNGYETEARQQLALLYKVRKMKINYDSLLIQQ